MDKKEERFKSDFESPFLATQGNISIASFREYNFLFFYGFSFFIYTVIYNQSQQYR